MERRKNIYAVPIQELLGRVLRKTGVSRISEHVKVFKAWESIVPETIASRTRPVSYRNGKLIVVVDSSPLLEEVSCFRQKELLILLNGWLAQQSLTTKIQDLEFRGK